MELIGFAHRVWGPAPPAPDGGHQDQDREEHIDGLAPVYLFCTWVLTKLLIFLKFLISTSLAAGTHGDYVRLPSPRRVAAAVGASRRHAGRQQDRHSHGRGRADPGHFRFLFSSLPALCFRSHH